MRLEQDEAPRISTRFPHAASPGSAVAPVPAISILRQGRGSALGSGSLVPKRRRSEQIPAFPVGLLFPLVARASPWCIILPSELGTLLECLF
ncbi:hypothetical protein EJB05_55768, partial [Eragrostis curvula]